MSNSIIFKYFSHHLNRFALLVGVVAAVMIPPLDQVGASEAEHLPAPPGRAATSSWNQVELVIVTTAEMLPEFRRLADWRSDHGISATAVTVDWITDVAPAGADPAETVRNFLIRAHDQWAANYVLLGGGDEVLPTRLVQSPLGLGFPPYTEPWIFASDWYFGCLDGTWDGDGDGIYAEYGGDEPDLVPELAVGRAPVRTPEEAAGFVDKVLDHEQSAGSGHLDRALLLGEVLSPWDWVPGQTILNDGAEYLEDLLPVLESATSPMTTDRLYENTGAYVGCDSLNRQSTLAALDSGEFGLVYHIGHGFESVLSVGGEPRIEFLRSSDMSALTNAPRYFVIMALVGPTAMGSEFILDTAVRHPHGGAVAAFGRSEVSFVYRGTSFDAELLAELVAADGPRLGDALVRVVSERAPDALTNTSLHLTLLESVLLGDPTLRLRPTAVSAVPPAVPTAGAVIHACTPNPFNPRTVIRFEVMGSAGARYDVKVDIHDLRGRTVVNLLDDALEPGRYDQAWSGVDRDGRPKSAGVYLVTVQVADHSAFRKIVLVK